MCHLNIIKRKDEYCDDSINYYMDIVSWNSFISNHDGEGFIGFTNRKMLLDRSVNKILYKNLDKFHTLITHQRFATSGFNLSNVHPHESKHFIIQHNGVFTGIGDKDKSDTRCYLERLEEHFEKSKDLITSIKNVNKEIHGSFSIVLLSKKTNRIFYYKNSSTNMSIIEDKNYIIMSTSKNNLRLARIMFNMKGSIKDVKDDILYELTTNGLKFVTRLQPKVKKQDTTLMTFASQKSKDDFESYFDDKLQKFDVDDNIYDNSFYYVDENGKRISMR